MIIPLVVVCLLVLLVSSNPLVRMPIGAVVALAVLTGGLDTRMAVAAAAIAVTVSRAAIGRAARTREASEMTPETTEALRSWLAANPAYGRTTFMAGAIPFIPGRVLFGLLGAMRFPLRWAIIGCMIGQLALIAISTTFMLAITDLLTADDTAAAQLLGTYAVLLVIVRLVLGFDRETWRQQRRVRFRTEAEDRRIQVFMDGVNRSSAPTPQHLDIDDVIDVEAEEVRDDPRLPPPPPPANDSEAH